MRALRTLRRAVVTPRFALYRAARKVVKRYEGFSYDFDSNGEARFLACLPKDRMHTVFDVGANVGGWSRIALAEFPQAQIHAFELSEATFHTLSRNLSDETRIRLNNTGLANTEGSINYKDYGAEAGINTIIGSAGFHDARVAFEQKSGQLTTGDAYCRAHGIEQIDLLKIDVEGAEHLVMDGFADMLAAGKVRALQFEYGYSNGDAKFLMKDFYDRLDPLGYAIGPLKPSGVLFMAFGYGLNDFDSGPNFVAVHRSEAGLMAQVQGKPIRGFPSV